MERADLLDINGQIFAEQGKALDAVASRNVKVLVVGNPCNTNALIRLKNAPNISAKNFHALTRLDENRAKCQVYTTGNPYGIAEDIVFSVPCRLKGDGDYELVKDVIIDDYLRDRIKKTVAELFAEKRCVAHLTGEGNAYYDLPEDTMHPGEQ